MARRAVQGLAEDRTAGEAEGLDGRSTHWCAGVVQEQGNQRGSWLKKSSGCLGCGLMVRWVVDEIREIAKSSARSTISKVYT
jgi:hypothetical protein